MISKCPRSTAYAVTFVLSALVSCFLNAASCAQELPNLSILNSTKYPVQVYFVRAGCPCESFVVWKIKPQDSALLEGLSFGEWHAVAFDLATGHSLASDRVLFTPDNPHSIEIAAAQGGYRLGVIQNSKPAMAPPPSRDK